MSATVIRMLSFLPPKLVGLIAPLVIYIEALKAYTSVLLSDLTSLKIPNLPSVKSRAFGVFWAKLSTPPDPPQPPVGSELLVPPICAQATGTVLDVGPGSGTLINLFDGAYEQGRIQRIFGAEPAIELHDLLGRNVRKTKVGGAGKYTVLGAGATYGEVAGALVEQGVVKRLETAEGMFDTVVAVRVLCSVPNQRQMMGDLWRLLKPGGKLLIVEHTVNPWRTPKGWWVARLMQTVYMMLGWSYFIGDCALTKDTEGVLRGLTVGGRNAWETVDIEKHFGASVLCYISGVLVKRQQ